MFSVGWRTGWLFTRIVRTTHNTVTMGNCADKTHPVNTKVKPATESVVTVCNEDDLRDSEPKEFKLRDNLSCLVVKQNGKIYALGNKCTHYGAPLATGSVGNGVITCPWHGACFNLASGDIEDFPGLDSLPKYPVDVENGQVKVHFSHTDTKRTKVMAKHVPEKSNETIVVIGGGAAGQECVETLRNREKPFLGRIILLTQENCRPYDRIKLSKSLSSSAEELALRPLKFYEDSDIEIMTGTEVVGVDTANKEIKLRSGNLLGFDYLVVATGGTPRTLNIPGYTADNIFVLRSPIEANQILSNSEGKSVVIIGSSFIGMEVAAALVGKASSVTVVGNGAVPFSALGEEIGKLVQGWHEEKGVKFIMNSAPEEFVANEEGILTHVVVVGGERIEADVAVLGIGVEPATRFLIDTNVDMDSRGNIVVNEFMESSVSGIYAAGDIASFPLDLPTTQGLHAAIGHWQLAMSHGKCAGLNLASDTKSPLHTVPFFWTMQYGKGIRYAGYCQKYDDILYDGDVAAGKFVAYYCKNDDVMAVATLGRDPIAAKFANLLRDGNVLNKSEALNFSA